MRTSLFLLPLFCGLLSPLLSEGAPSYTVVDLGQVGNSQGQLFIAGINDSGQIAGSYQTADGSGAFIYSDGVLSDLGNFGGTYTQAFGINNAGQVVGTSATPDVRYYGGPAFIYQNGVMTNISDRVPTKPLGINDKGQIIGEYSSASTNWVQHAFLFTGNVATDLGTLRNWESSPTALNSLGEVVGTSYVGSYEHGFLYTGGRMIDLGSFDPKSEEVIPTAINDHHQIVGTVQTHTAQVRAFLYEKGKMTNLGVLGGDGSGANGISDSGVIVGWSEYRKDSRANHAFIYEDGKMADLNKQIPSKSGWVLTGALGINKRGQIVGSGIKDTYSRAFLLTPVPVVTVSGGVRRTTTLSRVTIRGRATSVVKNVVYRNGAKRPVQTAIGTNRWHFDIRLHPGENVISIQAQTIGGHSVPVKLTITRG